MVRGFDLLEIEQAGGRGPLAAGNWFDDQGFIEHSQVEGCPPLIDAELFGDLFRLDDAFADELQDISPDP